MSVKEHVLEEVRAAFRSERRFGPHGHVHLELSDDGTLTIEGEVRDVGVKKLLLERAAAHAAVTGIADRLRVAAAQPMGDKQIRDLVHDALLQDPALADVTIREEVKDEVVTVRQPPEARAEICIAVHDGIVTLNGEVPSLAHKRLAGVLAWWVPGSRDVINGLEVFPPEEDTDEEITEAVRIALEKDPFVDAGQVRVTTRDAMVTLEGVVPKEAEREMAECDAWYVFGVDKVKNKIAVHPAPPTGQFG